MEGCSNSCSASSSCGSSLMVPPLNPKAPPGGLDLYGKRRQLVKLQILEKEIGSLQEELKSLDTFQPASRCCKELDDFIEAKPDPLVAMHKQSRKSKSGWKWLCCPIICCYGECHSHLKKPRCCGCSKKLCSSEFHRCCCLGRINCQSCCKCDNFRCQSLNPCCLNCCSKVNLCSSTCNNPCSCPDFLSL